MTVPASTDLAFRDRAASEALLDVAYDLTDSPVGPLLVAVTERGVCRISYDAEPERQVESLARAFGARVLRSPRPLDEVKRELDEYFAGDRTEFSLPLDPVGTDFQLRAWAALSEIPFGETRSYGQQAARIGSPTAVRAVGAANGRNPIAIIVPCHRVVGAEGSLTGYAGGMDAKRFLLALEDRAQPALFS